MLQLLVSRYKVFALALFLVADALPAYSLPLMIAAPSFGEGAVSTPGGPFSDLAGTAQVGFGNAIFNGVAIGSTITGIGFRLDGDAVTGPAIDLTFAQWDLQMSQSLNAPYNLSSTFADNIASDVVQVRSGSLTLTANSLVDMGVGVPNPFLFISFTTPYTYTGGNLLLTLRKSGHNGDSSNDPLIDAVDNTGLLIENLFGFGWGSVVAPSTSSTSGFVNQVNVPIVDFVFAPPQTIPLPSTLALLGLALAGIGLTRRKK